MSYSIIFMGTPEFSTYALSAIHEADHNIPSVYTQKPKPFGRNYQVKKSPVHLLAESLGITVYTPVSLRREEVYNEIKGQQPDIIIVSSYGFIIPQNILDIPKYGCINIHASVLPRWRGAAPIHHAIMAGDKETGISLMKMDAGMDTGGVIRIEKIPISGTDNFRDVYLSLAQLGAAMIVELLNNLEAGLANAYAQNEQGVTIAGKITKEMEQIDWSLPANIIERNIRAFSPEPGMWSEIEGARVKVFSATVIEGVFSEDIGTVLDKNFTVQCGDGTALVLNEVQPAGKSRMSGKAFLNGRPNLVHSQFIIANNHVE